MRYLVRERMFGIGEDFWVENEHGERAFLVDGKALRLRQTFELKDSEGRVAVTVKAKAFSLRGAMRIERDGEVLATVREKPFTPMREVFHAELPGGEELEIRGDLVGKEYDIEYGGRRLARISRRWFRVREAYAVQVEAEDADPAMLIAVAVCVDQLAQRE
ncbi:LURP-one-related/scramblase family protein [Streptomyces sp. JJ36]|uniref:LURP-one-related/scramblase family protein n=1 Tax=Streptomyces sp. JJ36 TaxID=2736645 RepID=UPI001F3DAF27|nr:LURP-one-related family protein [Streptomyces sp. JJ36]MCF6524072.1 LURP-one-related family protein [Streptomyces sp. JJ36]